MHPTLGPGIEAQIGEWRSYLLRRRTIHDVDVDELEDHLRSQIAELGATGLSGDEAFLVAIKRLGGINDLSREFARERSSRLWKQLVLGGDGAGEHRAPEYLDLVVTLCFAIGAAVAFKLPALFGIDPFVAADGADGEADASFYLRNTALLALPFLVGLLAWKRALPRRVVGGLAVKQASAPLSRRAGASSTCIPQCQCKESRECTD